MKSNIFSGYQIRDISIRPGLVLSPMSGVTNSAFRRLINELNPGCVGLLVSEFISVEGMTRGSRRSIEMMNFHPSENPYAVQIFGYDVIRMRDAALMAQDAGADIVDINCGCPAPKVVKNGGGCELMRQPAHLGKIFREVKNTLQIPLTMKMRSGWDENSINAFEIAHIAESEGVEAIAVHGRTRTQMYRGESDWSIVNEIASRVSVPVLGSGDIDNRANAVEALSNSKISGIFIGRASIYNPYVFSEIVEGKNYNLNKNPVLLVKVIERYIELLLETFKIEHCVGRVKQLVSQMGKGHRWAKEICRVQTLEEQQAILLSVKSDQVNIERDLAA